MHEKAQLPLLGLILSIGIVISTYLVTDVIRDVRLSHQIIKVRGYAERAVVSDLAIWDIRLKTRAQSVQEGYPVIEKQKDKVQAFLKNHGIGESEIKVSPIRVSEVAKVNEKGNRTNEIDHLTLRLRLVVTSRNVQKIAVLSPKITELMGQGIGIDSSSVRYLYSKVNDIKSELLTAATKDARMRAKTLAEGSGVKLGFLRAARQGGFSVRSDHAAGISSDGPHRDDTSSINKKITAVVTVDYSMK